MARQLVHTEGHYRTLPTGQVVYVHDYHANHEINARSAPSRLHERVVHGRRLNGQGFLRATNAREARIIEDVAKQMGETPSRTRAGANHHGRSGAYELVLVSSPEVAKRVHDALRNIGEGDVTQSPRPTRNRTARVEPMAVGSPATQQAAQATAARANDSAEQFASIFGGASLPPVQPEEVRQQFASIFGDLPELRVSQRFGGHPRQQAEPLTMAKVREIAARMQAEHGMEVTVTQDFLGVWNNRCKQDFEQYLLDCFQPFGQGLQLSFAGRDNGTNGASMSIRGKLHGKIEELVRTFRWDARNGNGSVSHAYLRLALGVQGGGYATEFIGRSMDYYQKFGIKKVEVNAALDGGGYAWSRYGFLPKEPGSWNDQFMRLQVYWRTMKEAKARNIMDAMIRGEANQMKKAKLAELKTWMDNPANVRMLDSILANGSAPVNDVYNQWKIADTPLGGYGMPGTSFRGVIDMTNPRQLERFEKYLNYQRAKNNATQRARRAAQP